MSLSKKFQEVGQKQKMRVIKIEFTPLSLSDCKIFPLAKKRLNLQEIIFLHL